MRVIALLLWTVFALRAQDTRQVSEPRVPETCIVLPAQLAAPNGVLDNQNAPDTARIQSALDNCQKGRAVALRAAAGKNVFLTVPLELRPGVTLLIEGGVAPSSGAGCKPLIAANRAPGSAIMGDGVIDGRGGAKLLGQDITWWEIAKKAKVMDTTYTVPRLITVTQSDYFTLYRITLRNSFNYHVAVSQTDGFTAWGVKLKTPRTARNTDGIDPSSSTNVTIAYCDIDTGDDNVAIKSGAQGPAAHMTIAHNHFYAGHGMSIGSNTNGGVSDIQVSDLSLTPGWVTFLGLDPAHKIAVTLDNFTIDRQNPAQTTAQNVDLKVLSQSSPVSCQNAFVPFPADPTPQAAVAIPPDDKTLYVAASGTGDYYSIQHAIDVAPADGAVISIAPGIYREVLKISKPNIHLRSPYSDPSKTVIVFDNSAGTSGGTQKSATVTVDAANFTAENLTFANDFNATHPQLSQGSQALAIAVTGDRAVFRNMRFLGNQDTVYAAKGRQYFANSYIEGNVDFIFGDGKTVFENCEIHSTEHSSGNINAQGKDAANKDNGYVFNHCKLTAASGVTQVWLGRPWRPYATVIFLNTEMGSHIEPAGWREWHPGETDYLQTVFYAEFNSSGPGAHVGQRDPHTRLLTPAEAAQYETKRYLAGSDGWNPEVVR